LATATGKGLWGQSYSYARWGNRTSVRNTISGQDIQNVTLQPQQGAPAGVPSNQIATVNGVSYSYDASGNLTTGGGHSYQYDAESRMVTVDVNTASSIYDSANRRVKKTAGGVTTHYVWEGSQVIAEYNSGTGALISEYVFAGSRMVAREQSGVLRYFLQDRLSTRIITDTSGNLVGREDHLPFGEDAGTGSGESEKHRFTSYERDAESNTDYAINRQYSNSAGRFNRPDPLAGNIADPQSLNRYAYVRNDPVNATDPLGLVTLIDCTLTSSTTYAIFDSHITFTVDTYACSALEVGFRDPGEGKKRRLPRKGGRKTNAECRSIFEKLKAAVEEVVSRFNDLAVDRQFLSITGNRDSFYGGDRQSHVNEYNLQRDRVTDLTNEFNKGQCRGRSGAADENSILNLAKQMPFWRVPEPQHGIVHPSAGVNTVWDNGVPVMPFDPYFPGTVPLRVPLRIPLRIPIEIPGIP
jgi:RHS repeat-associated protein